MLEIKVWLGGEGNCELGSGTAPGAVEALLRTVEATGWRVDGATQWRRIRKFRVGRAGRDDNHEDIHNVCGLALTAWEAGCEVLAFIRDVDADERRAGAIAEGIAVARERHADVRVIGGCVARPALDAWILALAGARDTDAMSRTRALEELRSRDIDAKSHAAYVEVIERADLTGLPAGCESLHAWLATARAELTSAVHGS
jgi:hypothetical protein